MAQNNLANLTQQAVIFYRDLSFDIASPVDPKLDARTQCELYQSKIVYLQKLLKIGMKNINISNPETKFKSQELDDIKTAILKNSAFLQQQLFILLKRSLDLHAHIRKQSHGAKGA